MPRATALRFTNTAILLLVVVLTLTGLYGLIWTLSGWAYDVHRVAGWTLIALIPSKAVISSRSLRRGVGRDFDRGGMLLLSTVLAVAAAAVILLGLLWHWRLGPDELWLRQTAISWHWLLGLALLVPLGIHTWRRWPRPRRADFFSRRGLLKLGALTLAGVLSWRLGEILAGIRESAAAPRRFTGSRLAAAFSGNRFPVTNNPGEGAQNVDLSSWRLEVTGLVRDPRAFSYQDLLSLPAMDRIATLDCTLGWYTNQVWRGVLLGDLLSRVGLESRAAAVRLAAVSGYAHTFALDEAREIILATHVGGEVLDHWHGFPVRAVVPSRRGWFWVKWLATIEAVGW